jgi:hypothetical protein
MRADAVLGLTAYSLSTKLQRRYEKSELGKAAKRKGKTASAVEGRKKILRRPRTQQTVNDLLTLSS